MNNLAVVIQDPFSIREVKGGLKVVARTIIENDKGRECSMNIGKAFKRLKADEDFPEAVVFSFRNLCIPTILVLILIKLLLLSFFTIRSNFAICMYSHETIASQLFVMQVVFVGHLHCLCAMNALNDCEFVLHTCC